MTCKACFEAERNPQTGYFGAGCKQCDARAIAMSPAAWKASNAKTNVDLQESIERVFGADSYSEGRVLVWKWMQKLGVA